MQTSSLITFWSVQFKTKYLFFYTCVKKHRFSYKDLINDLFSVAVVIDKTWFDSVKNHGGCTWISWFFLISKVMGEDTLKSTCYFCIINDKLQKKKIIYMWFLMSSFLHSLCRSMKVNFTWSFVTLDQRRMSRRMTSPPIWSADSTELQKSVSNCLT